MNDVWIALIAGLVSLGALGINAWVAYVNQRSNKLVEKKVEEKAAIHTVKLEKVAADIDGRITQLISTIASEKFQEGIIQGTKDEQVRVAEDKLIEAKARALIQEESQKTRPQ